MCTLRTLNKHCQLEIGIGNLPKAAVLDKNGISTIEPL